MDKLARTESSPARRTNREERPVHPCTRDLVFSLATCGSLFVLGSWSLTAVGCSAGARTNEQRMAQRRSTPEAMAAKQAAKNSAMGLSAAPTQLSNGAVTPLVTASANNGSSNGSSNGSGNTTNGGSQGMAAATVNDAATLNEMTSQRESMALSNTRYRPQGFESAIAQANTSDRLASKPQLQKTYLPNGKPVLVDPTLISQPNSTQAVATSNSNSNTNSGKGNTNFSPKSWPGSTDVAVDTNSGNNDCPPVAVASGNGNNGNGTNFRTIPANGGMHSVALARQSRLGTDGDNDGGNNGTGWNSSNSNTAVAANNNNTNTNSSNGTGNNPGASSTTELSKLLANAFAQAGTGSMDPLRVWFIYSSLAVSNPDIELPQGWSDDLVPAERDRVVAAHAGFAALGRAFRDGANHIDSGTRQALVAALTGEPALTIPKVDLATKVVGYNDYSPISRRNFLAGASNRVIVYSELDGFKSNLENGKWTTRLATRVSITPADSNTVAWSRSPEWTPVVDSSDNPRCEFFLGEIIPIGTNLAAGSYNVKVEVKDLATGAVTSSFVPFKVMGEREYAAATERDGN